MVQQFAPAAGVVPAAAQNGQYAPANPAAYPPLQAPAPTPPVYPGAPVNPLVAQPPAAPEQPASPPQWDYFGANGPRETTPPVPQAPGFAPQGFPQFPGQQPQFPGQMPQGPQDPAAPQQMPQLTMEQYQQLQRDAQNGRELEVQVRELYGQTMQQRQVEAHRAEVQTRVDEAYATAAEMEPEKAIAYLRKFTAAEVANAQQAGIRARDEAIQQREAELEAALAPAYAIRLQNQYRLSPQNAQLLATMHPREQDKALPMILANERSVQGLQQGYQDVLNRLDQLMRSGQAAAASQVTSFPPAPGGAMPIASQPAMNGGVEPGSASHLLAQSPEIAAMFGYRRK